LLAFSASNRTASGAKNQAELDHAGIVTQETVESICRRVQHAEFGGLAHKLPCPFSESDIVLPKKTADELHLICTWARCGRRLFHPHGLGRNLRTGKGLVCLFSGPPGTGKTMAAQVIGRRIGFDVYRIDLSQIVNKYVGETEKNLAKVFDEAQRSKAVLFFDEAETLYGDRTDVKTAQDRFANIEIGYLLQRIETFEGIAILATNLQKNLDEAFLRRLNVIAEFPIPEAAERLQIWNKLLPPAVERTDDVDVDLLSRQFRIAGGDIRNSIFSAMLFAADDEAELGMSHLVRGLWRELRKSGRIVDIAQFGSWRTSIADPAA
jgi:SpoVK/Ycf46/Vps4 family AAA+-type ATPase